MKVAEAEEGKRRMLCAWDEDEEDAGSSSPVRTREERGWEWNVSLFICLCCAPLPLFLAGLFLLSLPQPFCALSPSIFPRSPVRPGRDTSAKKKRPPHPAPSDVCAVYKSARGAANCKGLHNCHFPLREGLWRFSGPG